MKKRIILRFKRKTIDKPIVYRLAKDYDLVFNILRANVSPRATPIGSATMTEISRVEIDSAIVGSIRCAISVETGRLVKIEMPRSPCKSRRAQSPN